MKKILSRLNTATRQYVDLYTLLKRLVMLPFFREQLVVFDILERSMTGIAIVLDGQQLLAEERKKRGLGGVAIGTTHLLRLLLSSLVHDGRNLFPTASQRDQGSGSVGCQRFVAASKPAGTAISRLLRVGITFPR